MILHFPPSNDNAPPALWVCPLCENGAFLLEASADDGIIIKCASCFADCTQAVVVHLAVSVGDIAGADPCHQ